MAEVELINISKNWGHFVAVDNQSIKIADREFLALLGPSGCGKTTMLRMIAGLETPSAGNIHINGVDVTETLPKDRDVAMVFQNYGLYPHMTVAENIAYPLRVRKVPKTDIPRRVRTAADTTRITELLERRPRELSGGQRQRVALARAIVRQPAVFLMDEPLSNLDAQLRASMRAELQHLSRQLQITTIYVTHDQIEAMSLADRVAVMQHGRICQLAAPLEIHHKPANTFVAGFIGSPPMNLIRGTIWDGDFCANGMHVAGLDGGSSRRDVILGTRPEDITAVHDDTAHLRAAIYAAEKTGDSTLITVEINQQRLTARLHRDLPAAIGDNIALAINTNHCCLFDAASGERL